MKLEHCVALALKVVEDKRSEDARSRGMSEELIQAHEVINRAATEDAIREVVLALASANVIKLEEEIENEDKD